MANKKNLARRNKKPNNWKAIKKIREENKKIARPENEEEAYNNHDQGQNDLDHPVTAIVFPEAHTDNDDEELYQSTNNSFKRRRTHNREVSSFIDVSENYFDCLGEDEDGLIPMNPNQMTNHNETLPISDPLSSVDEYEQEDLEEDIDDENDGCDDVHGNGGSHDDDEDNDLASTDEARQEVIHEEKPSGRRLFDITELFEQVKRLGRHSRLCNFNDMELESETKKGLNSILKFRCHKCGVVRKLQSCPKKRNDLNCNEAAVLGINSIGSGFSHLTEFFTHLNVPVMGPTLYDKIQNDQQKDWYNLAKASALEALQEEIELAKASGSVDSKGNALIAVICDGGWGKRSYGKAFNSLSGCAVLIGVKTKKVVFFGTRNKYCHVCKIAESKGVAPKEHTCNINYVGPSSGMEADIIVEGFKSSEQHGARYFKFIADGDSSTYKAIRDNRIYRNPDLFVEKFECVNHLCRNFRTKFSFLNTVAKFNSDLRRKQIKPSKARDICKGIKSAASHWRESNLDMTQKIYQLEEDIMNAPNHYFGVHDKCQSYFCNKVTQQGAIDNLKLMKEDGLYYEVMNLCQSYFAFHAKSLILNYTNNPAEEFNNNVAKYLGGKRINYSLAGSYSARVSAAVVQYNSKGHVGSEFRKYKFGDSDNSRIEKLENSRKRKLAVNEVARQAKPRDRRVAQKDISNTAYFHGDGSEEVDMEPANFEKAKEVHFEKLKYNQRIRRSVEQSTIGGRQNEHWQQIRQDLIPSSFFSKIIKAKNRNSYTNHLEELMYKRSEFGNSAEIKHQRLVERDALKVFESIFDVRLQRCGLFIDTKLCFLCASPLRLEGNNYILNIKCPNKLYNKRFDDVIDKIPFWKNEHGYMNINKNSDWYIELQADIHITRRKYGYIMVWLGEFEGEPQYRVVEVPRDDDYFEKQIQPKLIYFYNEVMVKELIDPRKGRNMKLRAYDAEKESFV